MWLSGLSAGLSTERSPVRFPVGAHDWVVGRVPSWGCAKGVFLSHVDVSLPLFLLSPLPKKINKIFKNIYIFRELICKMREENESCFFFTQIHIILLYVLYINYILYIIM